jgi:hypothetical protein
MSSVLLPMPGSPPMSVTEPATSPPPSTRSSSGTSVGNWDAPAVSTSPIGIGTGTERSPTATRFSDRRPEAVRAGAAGAGAVSATEPHVPHSVHRPSHLGDW